MVQKEFERRKKSKQRYSGNGIFASRIICGECGGFYGAKVWHSNSKYRRVVYQCNNKFKNKDKCKTPHLSEETIKGLFVKAVNGLLSDRDEIIAGLKIVEQSLFDIPALDRKHEDLKGELAVVAETIQKTVNENAHVAQSQKEYRLKYDVRLTFKMGR
jgi:hypothetical protein